MFTALFVVIGLSILILGHEAGHFFVAKLFKLRVDEFGIGFPPRIKAWRPFDKARGKPGETEYSINWLPFGGFVKIAGENDALSGEITPGATEMDKKRMFAFQSVAVRSAIALAGIVMNFLIGWALLTLVLLIGAPKAVVISAVQHNSPAEQAGFLAGDVVEHFTDSAELIAFINQHKGEPTTLTVIRGGKDVSITAVPRVSPGAGEGPLGIILADAGTEREGLFPALWDGLRNSISVCGMTAMAFLTLIRDLALHGSLLAGVVGPVGIFSVAQETGRVGWVYLIQLLSVISLNLTVVNLIPFPALDGGRFFMILIEKIKGSPISRRLEGIVNVVGFGLLLVLMLLLTFRDVWNLF